MTARPGAASQLLTPSVESIVSLTRELVAIPSRGGEDSCEPMIEHVATWLKDHHVAVSVLTADTGRPVAVVGEVTGTAPGPTYCLDACLDTAPFGELAAWDHPPTESHLVDGWLYGRGAADCKVAVAIFSHLAADFQQLRDNLRGRLLVLFDADEHTGDFAGVKTFLHSYPQLDGVLIGYPGNYGIVVGARGFYRATVTVHGVGGHSGGRQEGSQNAILKAARLAQALDAATLPTPITEAFPLAPSLTVTGIAGGQSFSTVPDRCDLNVDIRLTPNFDPVAARDLLQAAIDDVDAADPATTPTSVRESQSWPPYRLPNRAPIVQAMLTAARAHHNPQIAPVVCGPSNIGNYFAAHRIDATCGFGVTYENLHAPNERIKLDTIQMTSDVYSTAIQSLLASAAAPPLA
ncbi:MAG: succinyl-diaminopimelate desuccinylase [Solirubrobacteraceae bacterium]|nr:succinyl-diaminopimelate desuccinylase [Solirubrobacteraceae bacterium]